MIQMASKWPYFYAILYIRRMIDQLVYMLSLTLVSDHLLRNKGLLLISILLVFLWCAISFRVFQCSSLRDLHPNSKVGYDAGIGIVAKPCYWSLD